jgi:glutamate formiminotransferase
VLLAVPNVSEGRDAAVLDAIGAAFAAGGARLLDRHADPDHHRAVFTLAGDPGTLHEALAAGAGAAIERIDITRDAGLHPHVCALDVAPSSSAPPRQRGSAAAEALALADALGELGLPVFLYGVLADGRTRAELRAAAAAGLAQRIADGLEPDFGHREDASDRGRGPSSPRARRLVAFNHELGAEATADDARAHRARHPRERCRGAAGPARDRAEPLRARRRRAGLLQRRGPRGAAPRRACFEAVERHAP